MVVISFERCFVVHADNAISNLDPIGFLCIFGIDMIYDDKYDRLLT